MIALKNIEKYYSSGFQKSWVLRDISVQIEQGEFVTIMGPSGAGKSTLLNIIGMLDQADKGEYRFLDEMVFRLREKQKHALHKAYMGFVFQAYHLIDELTVYENIETPLLYRKVPRSERKALIADLLDRFGIVAKRDLFPHQLSGGHQQLVGVARAIVASPKLLLADEPTGNLHSSQGKIIMDLLKQLHTDGMTILQVTHSEKNAEYGTRVLEIQDGFIRHDYAVDASSISDEVP
ncbi:MAG: ABC transporter ATP-binding protein [Saprospiraceae bacterium]|nr:ABC transporter ATP-binding protein [Saprospiraceae bacterium]